MSTNFYWKNLPKELKQYDIDITYDKFNPVWHIGKRNAAGKYCIDCGITFCMIGTSKIHYDKNPYKFLSKEWKEAEKHYWYDKCPLCGKEGIVICSFTWTFMKQKEIIKNMVKNNISKKLIVNEYEEEFTPKEFLEQELYKCKVEYQSYGRFC